MQYGLYGPSTEDLSLATTNQAQEKKIPKDYIVSFYHHPSAILTLRKSFIFFFVNTVHCLEEFEEFEELCWVVGRSLYVILKLGLSSSFL